MDKLKQAFREFNEERDWDQFHTPENLAKSISIEAGELLECFQWNNDFDKVHLCEELADVINYCFLMADRLDLDVDEIVRAKIAKNREKYPAELAYGNSAKYTELKEAGRQEK